MNQKDALLENSLLGKALIYHRAEENPTSRLVNPGRAAKFRDNTKPLQLVVVPSLQKNTVRDCLLLLERINVQG